MDRGTGTPCIIMGKQTESASGSFICQTVLYIAERGHAESWLHLVDRIHDVRYSTPITFEANGRTKKRALNAASYVLLSNVQIDPGLAPA
ncbi:hypothetical protein FRB96_008954 [Tulasnella sp. 330]|nr:hypothetical protein FRB96_008954 [Tulasnella sp. 330]KAG8869286.1 hypothetical protein FRB97_001368 [Tulasnella sp. 331]KAG8870722.1 hypothetical protein FRB98_001383 [Tulasnella sp. 332]